MINIIVRCNRHTYAMHRNNIVHDKHSCALHWDALLMISKVVQCYRNM